MLFINECNRKPYISGVRVAPYGVPKNFIIYIKDDAVY